MTRDLVAARDRINSLLTKVAEIDDTEMQAHWARYLCVLVCGFLEVAVADLLTDYAEKRADPFVAKYVAKHLRRFQNPKMARILTLVSEFSAEWRDEIDAATSGQPRRRRKQYRCQSPLDRSRAECGRQLCAN